MNYDNIKHQSHNLYLRLFYSTPVLRANTALDIKVGAKTLRLKEPADAILCLMELLSEQSGFCYQGYLEDKVCKWFGVATSSSFDKSLALLGIHNCVAKERNPSNQRQNKLSLTPRGRQLVGRVKKHRTQALQPILQALEECDPNFLSELSRVLNKAISVTNDL